MAIDLGRWKPDLHPRDSKGRFRDKWGLSPAAMSYVDRLLANFSPPSLDSDGHAATHLRTKKPARSVRQKAALKRFLEREGNENIQGTLRAGDDPTPDIKELDGMMTPLGEDLIVSRVFGPDALGLRPEDMDGVEEWTGKRVLDAGFSPTNVGSPYAIAGPHIEMRLLVPKGTKAIIVGDDGGPADARTVILDREQPIRFGKIQKDGRGGWYILATVDPARSPSGKEPARALGRALPAREKSPAIEATPDELERRGISPEEAGIPAPQEQPGRTGDPIPAQGAGQRVLPQAPTAQSIPNPAAAGPVAEGGPPGDVVQPAKAITEAGGAIPVGAGGVPEEGVEPAPRKMPSRSARGVATPESQAAADAKTRAAADKEAKAREDRRVAAEKVLADREAHIARREAQVAEQQAKVAEQQAQQIGQQQDLIDRLMQQATPAAGGSEGGTRAAGMTPAQKRAVKARVRPQGTSDEDRRQQELVRQIDAEEAAGGGDGLPTPTKAAGAAEAPPAPPAKKGIKKAAKKAAPEAPEDTVDTRAEEARAREAGEPELISAEDVRGYSDADRAAIADVKDEELAALSPEQAADVERLSPEQEDVYWARRAAGATHTRAMRGLAPELGARKKAAAARLAPGARRRNFIGRQVRGEQLKELRPGDVVEVPSTRGGKGKVEKTVRAVDDDGTLIFTDNERFGRDRGSVKVVSQGKLKPSGAAAARKQTAADKKAAGLSDVAAIKAVSEGRITPKQAADNLESKIAGYRRQQLELGDNAPPEMARAIAGLEKLVRDLRGQEAPTPDEARKTETAVKRAAKKIAADREAAGEDVPLVAARETPATKKAAAKSLKKAAAAAGPDLVDAGRPDADNVNAVRQAKSLSDVNAIANDRGVRIPSTVARREDRKAFLEKALSMQDGESKADYDARMAELKSPTVPVKRGRGRPRKEVPAAAPAAEAPAAAPAKKATTRLAKKVAPEAAPAKVTAKKAAAKPFDIDRATADEIEEAVNDGRLTSFRDAAAIYRKAAAMRRAEKDLGRDDGAEIERLEVLARRVNDISGGGKVTGPGLPVKKATRAKKAAPEPSPAKKAAPTPFSDLDELTDRQLFDEIAAYDGVGRRSARVDAAESMLQRRGVRTYEQLRGLHRNGGQLPVAAVQPGDTIQGRDGSWGRVARLERGHAGRISFFDKDGNELAETRIGNNLPTRKGRATKAVAPEGAAKAAPTKAIKKATPAKAAPEKPTITRATPLAKMSDDDVLAEAGRIEGAPETARQRAIARRAAAINTRRERTQAREQVQAARAAEAEAKKATAAAKKEAAAARLDAANARKEAAAAKKAAAAAKKAAPERPAKVTKAAEKKAAKATPEVSAPEAAPVSKAAPGTAAGRITALRMEPGTRVMMTRDADGNYRSTTRKTGAVPIEVTATGRAGGGRGGRSRIQITGTDPDGNEVRVSVSPSQTFPLEPAPVKKAAKAAAKAAPERPVKVLRKKAAKAAETAAPSGIGEDDTVTVAGQRGSGIVTEVRPDGRMRVAFSRRVNRTDRREDEITVTPDRVTLVRKGNADKDVADLFTDGRDLDEAIKLADRKDRQAKAAAKKVAKVAPERPAKVTKKATAPAFDRADAMSRLQNFENPPSREDAGALLENASRADLIAMAKEISVPGASRKTSPELRRELVEATAGRRLDSIAIRGFRGERPGRVGRVAPPELTPAQARKTAVLEKKLAGLQDRLGVAQERRRGNVQSLRESGLRGQMEDVRQQIEDIREEARDAAKAAPPEERSVRRSKAAVPDAEAPAAKKAAKKVAKAAPVKKAAPAKAPAKKVVAKAAPEKAAPAKKATRRTRGGPISNAYGPDGFLAANAEAAKAAKAAPAKAAPVKKAAVKKAAPVKKQSPAEFREEARAGMTPLRERQVHGPRSGLGEPAVDEYYKRLQAGEPHTAALRHASVVQARLDSERIAERAKISRASVGKLTDEQRAAVTEFRDVHADELNTRQAAQLGRMDPADSEVYWARRRAGADHAEAAKGLDAAPAVKKAAVKKAAAPEAPVKAAKAPAKAIKKATPERPVTVTRRPPAVASMDDDAVLAEAASIEGAPSTARERAISRKAGLITARRDREAKKAAAPTKVAKAAKKAVSAEAPAPKKAAAGYQDTGEVVPEADREGLHVQPQRWGGYGVYDAKQGRVEADYKSEAAAQRRVRELQAGDTVKKIIPKERTARQKAADEKEAARQNALTQVLQGPAKKAAPEAEAAPAKKATKASKAFREPLAKAAEATPEAPAAKKTSGMIRTAPAGRVEGVVPPARDMTPQQRKALLAKVRRAGSQSDAEAVLADEISVSVMRQIAADNGIDTGQTITAMRRELARKMRAVPDFKALRRGAVVEDAETPRAPRKVTPSTPAADAAIRARLNRLSPESREAVLAEMKPEGRRAVEEAVGRADARLEARKIAKAAAKVAASEAPTPAKAARKVTRTATTEAVPEAPAKKASIRKAAPERPVKVTRRAETKSLTTAERRAQRPEAKSSKEQRAAQADIARQAKATEARIAAERKAEDRAHADFIRPILKEAGVKQSDLSELDQTGLRVVSDKLRDGKISKATAARRLRTDRDSKLNAIADAIEAKPRKAAVKKAAPEAPAKAAKAPAKGIKSAPPAKVAKKAAVAKKTAAELKVAQDARIKAATRGRVQADVAETRRQRRIASRAPGNAPAAKLTRAPKGVDSTLVDSLTPDQVAQINDLSPDSQDQYWGRRVTRGIGHDSAWRSVPKGDVEALRVPSQEPRTPSPARGPGDAAAVEALRRPTIGRRGTGSKRLTEDEKDNIIRQAADAEAADPRFPATQADRDLAREAAEIQEARASTTRAIKATRKVAPKEVVKKVAPNVDKTRQRRADAYDAAVGDVPGDEGALLREAKADLRRGEPAASVKRRLNDRAEYFRTRAQIQEETGNEEVLPGEAARLHGIADRYEKAADLAGKRVAAVKKAVRPGEKVAVKDLEDGDTAVLDGKKGTFRQPKPRTTFIEFPDGTQEKVQKSRLASMVREKRLALTGGPQRTGTAAETPTVAKKAKPSIKRAPATAAADAPGNAGDRRRLDALGGRRDAAKARADELVRDGKTSPAAWRQALDEVSAVPEERSVRRRLTGPVGREGNVDDSLESRRAKRAVRTVTPGGESQVVPLKRPAKKAAAPEVEAPAAKKAAKAARPERPVKVSKAAETRAAKKAAKAAPEAPAEQTPLQARRAVQAQVREAREAARREARQAREAVSAGRASERQKKYGPGGPSHIDMADVGDIRNVDVTDEQADLNDGKTPAEVAKKLDFRARGTKNSAAIIDGGWDNEANQRRLADDPEYYGPLLRAQRERYEDGIARGDRLQDLADKLRATRRPVARKAAVKKAAPEAPAAPVKATRAAKKTAPGTPAKVAKKAPTKATKKTTAEPPAGGLLQRVLGDLEQDKRDREAPAKAAKKAVAAKAPAKAIKKTAPAEVPVHERPDVKAVTDRLPEVHQDQIRRMLTGDYRVAKNRRSQAAALRKQAQFRRNSADSALRGTPHLQRTRDAHARDMAIADHYDRVADLIYPKPGSTPSRKRLPDVQETLASKVHAAAKIMGNSPADDPVRKALDGGDNSNVVSLRSRAQDLRDEAKRMRAAGVLRRRSKDKDERELGLRQVAAAKEMETAAGAFDAHADTIPEAKASKQLAAEVRRTDLAQRRDQARFDRRRRQGIEAGLDEAEADDFARGASTIGQWRRRNAPPAPEKKAATKVVKKAAPEAPERPVKVVRRAKKTTAEAPEERSVRRGGKAVPDAEPAAPTKAARAAAKKAPAKAAPEAVAPAKRTSRLAKKAAPEKAAVAKAAKAAPATPPTKRTLEQNLTNLRAATTPEEADAALDKLSENQLFWIRDALDVAKGRQGSSWTRAHSRRAIVGKLFPAAAKKAAPAKKTVPLKKAAAPAAERSLRGPLEPGDTVEWSGPSDGDEGPQRGKVVQIGRSTYVDWESGRRERVPSNRPGYTKRGIQKVKAADQKDRKEALRSNSLAGLRREARELKVPGYTRMDKAQLAKAVEPRRRKQGETEADHLARITPEKPTITRRGVKKAAPAKAAPELRRAGSNDEAPGRLDAEEARDRLEPQLTERQRGQVDRLPTLQDKEDYWTRRSNGESHLKAWGARTRRPAAKKAAPVAEEIPAVKKAARSIKKTAAEVAPEAPVKKTAAKKAAKKAASGATDSPAETLLKVRTADSMADVDKVLVDKDLQQLRAIAKEDGTPGVTTRDSRASIRQKVRQAEESRRSHQVLQRGGYRGLDEKAVGSSWSRNVVRDANRDLERGDSREDVAERLRSRAQELRVEGLSDSDFPDRLRRDDEDRREIALTEVQRLNEMADSLDPPERSVRRGGPTPEPAAAKKAVKKATPAKAIKATPAKKVTAKKTEPEEKFLPPLANGTRRKSATNLRPGDVARPAGSKGEAKEVASVERPDRRGGQLKVTFTDGTTQSPSTNTAYWLADKPEVPAAKKTTRLAKKAPEAPAAEAPTAVKKARPTITRKAAKAAPDAEAAPKAAPAKKATTRLAKEAAPEAPVSEPTARQKSEATRLTPAQRPGYDKLTDEQKDLYWSYRDGGMRLSHARATRDAKDYTRLSQGIKDLDEAESYDAARASLKKYSDNELGDMLRRDRSRPLGARFPSDMSRDELETATVNAYIGDKARKRLTAERKGREGAVNSVVDDLNARKIDKREAVRQLRDLDTAESRDLADGLEESGDAEAANFRDLKPGDSILDTDGNPRKIANIDNANVLDSDGNRITPRFLDRSRVIRTHRAPEAAAPAKKATARKVAPRASTVQKNLLDADGPDGRRQVMDALHDDLSIVQWRKLAKDLGAGTQHGSKQDSRDAIERHMASGEGSVPKKSLRDQLRDADVNVGHRDGQEHMEDRRDIERAAGVAKDDPDKLRSEADGFVRTAQVRRGLALDVEAGDGSEKLERARLLLLGADNYDKAAKVFRARADAIDKGRVAAGKKTAAKAAPETPTPAKKTAAAEAPDSNAATLGRYRDMTREQYDALPAADKATADAALGRIRDSGDKVSRTNPSNRDSMRITSRTLVDAPHVEEARSILRRFKKDNTPPTDRSPQAIWDRIKALPPEGRRAAIKAEVRHMTKPQMKEMGDLVGAGGGSDSWKVDRFRTDFVDSLDRKVGNPASGRDRFKGMSEQDIIDDLDSDSSMNPTALRKLADDMGIETPASVKTGPKLRQHIARQLSRPTPTKAAPAAPAKAAPGRPVIKRAAKKTAPEAPEAPVKKAEPAKAATKAAPERPVIKRAAKKTTGTQSPEDAAQERATDAERKYGRRLLPGQRAQVDAMTPATRTKYWNRVADGKDHADAIDGLPYSRRVGNAITGPIAEDSPQVIGNAREQRAFDGMERYEARLTPRQRVQLRDLDDEQKLDYWNRRDARESHTAAYKKVASGEESTPTPVKKTTPLKKAAPEKKAAPAKAVKETPAKAPAKKAAEAPTPLDEDEKLLGPALSRVTRAQRAQGVPDDKILTDPAEAKAGMYVYWSPTGRFNKLVRPRDRPGKGWYVDDGNPQYLGSLPQAQIGSAVAEYNRMADQIEAARKKAPAKAIKKATPEKVVPAKAPVKKVATRPERPVKVTKAAEKATPAKATPAKATPAKAATPAKKATPAAASTVDESVSLGNMHEGDNMRMHNDSATMELARAYAAAGRNGSANRMVDLRRKATSRDAKDGLTPQEVVDELKKIRAEETDPAFQRRLDAALERIDSPRRPLPEIPANTPPAARKLIEDLNDIPYARKGNGERGGAGVVSGPSLVDQVAEVYRDAAAGRRDGSGRSPAERIRMILRNKTHEVNEASFRLWDMAENVDTVKDADGKTVASPLTRQLRQLERGELPSTPDVAPARKAAPSTPAKAAPSKVTAPDTPATTARDRITTRQKEARIRKASGAVELADNMLSAVEAFRNGDNPDSFRRVVGQDLKGRTPGDLTNPRDTRAAGWAELKKAMGPESEWDTPDKLDSKLRAVLAEMGIRVDHNHGDRVAFDPDSMDTFDGAQINPGDEVSVIKPGLSYRDTDGSLHVLRRPTVTRRREGGDTDTGPLAPDGPERAVARTRVPGMPQGYQDALDRPPLEFLDDQGRRVPDRPRELPSGSPMPSVLTGRQGPVGINLGSDEKGDTPPGGIPVRDFTLRSGYRIQHGTVFRQDRIPYLIEHEDTPEGKAHAEEIQKALWTHRQSLPLSQRRLQRSYTWVRGRNPKDEERALRLGYNPDSFLSDATSDSLGNTTVYNRDEFGFEGVDQQLDHEFAHTLDNVESGARGRVGSESPEWTDAARSDTEHRATLTDVTFDQGPEGGHSRIRLKDAKPLPGELDFVEGVTDYGVTDAPEDFAEAFRLYRAGPIGKGRRTPGGPMEPLWFRDVFPARAAILDEKVPDFAEKQLREIDQSRGTDLSVAQRRELVKRLIRERDNSDRAVAFRRLAGTAPVRNSMRSTLSPEDQAFIDRFISDERAGIPSMRPVSGTVPEGTSVQSLFGENIGPDGVEIGNGGITLGRHGYTISQGRAWRDGDSLYVIEGTDQRKMRRQLEELRAESASLPPELGQHTKTYVVVDHPSPAAAERLRRAGISDDFLPFASAGDGDIVFWDRSRSGPLGQDGQFAPTLRHETSHNADVALGNAAATREWFAAGRRGSKGSKVKSFTQRKAPGQGDLRPPSKDREKYRRAGAKYLDGVTPYGTSNVREDWAESAEFYFGTADRGGVIGMGYLGTGGRRVPIWFRDLFPARAAVLDQYFPEFAAQQLAEIRRIRG